MSDEAPVSATVEVTDGDGLLNAAGSMVDNTTGDPTSINTIHLEQVGVGVEAEQHVLVAAISHTRGLSGSYWMSSLDLLNPFPETQVVRLVFEAEFDETGDVGTTREAHVALAPGRQKHWDDALVDLFGVPMDSRTQGSVHIYSPTGVMASSRTYNSPLGGGTFGSARRPSRPAIRQRSAGPGRSLVCGTPTTPE